MSLGVPGITLDQKHLKNAWLEDDSFPFGAISGLFAGAKCLTSGVYTLLEGSSQDL